MCPSRVLVASTPCVNLRRRADLDYVDPLLLYCFVFWFSWMAADRAGHSGPQRCGAHGCNFALDDCDEFWIRLTIEMVKMSCHLANAIVNALCQVWSDEAVLAAGTLRSSDVHWMLSTYQQHLHQRRLTRRGQQSPFFSVLLEVFV